ncbi:flavin reductase family protein [Aestuariimicrobium soli]|uniref:flavin reductase family protein n=1 Tax=Aestuariimicrobium soli TaxID=2035834 RepID=UPI003EB8A0BE
MTIHSSHPFLDSQRDAGRQLRGRLGARVSIWTSGTLPEASDLTLSERLSSPASGAAPAPAEQAAGLTVSSMMVAAGDPWRLIALLDPDAALTHRLRSTGTAAVNLIDWPDRHLADVFAGLAPAPGGPFAAADFEATPWGPHLASSATWAGVELEAAVEVGWSLQVTCVARKIHLGDDPEPLHHVRGHYLKGGGASHASR